VHPARTYPEIAAFVSVISIARVCDFTHGEEKMRRTGILASAIVMVTCTMMACGSDDEDSKGGTGGTSTGGSGGSGASGGTGGSAGGAQTLCQKYGGPGTVETAIGLVVQEIGNDCRINSFFATANLAHVQGCLTIQAQELFQCEGITYAGSDFEGTPCRSMKDAHAGLGIGKGDFDALIDDVVKGLTAAGVESADIQAAAPALLGMESDIVENASATDPTMSSCDGGTGDGG
jgi:hypothetical protein